MNYSKIKVQSYGKIHGGKSRYARQYLSAINSDGFTNYIEPYCAGAGVLMNVPRGTFRRETLNDADTNITRTLLALRDQGDKVIRELQVIPYDEDSFVNAGDYIGHPDPVIHAVNYIVRNRMSSGGQFKRFGKTDTSVRLRGGRMGDENAWVNFTQKHIYETIGRLQGVEIRNECALDLIGRSARKSGASKTLYFLDPPYLKHTRVTKNNYFHEVDENHHVKLLDLITKIPGRIYICGYYSDIYNQKLVTENGWKYVTFSRHADSSNQATKPTRVEYLWTNAGASP